MAETTRESALDALYGNRPIPDPTAQTSDAIDRAVSSLRELLEARISRETEPIKATIAAMDKAIIVFADNLTRVPTDVDKQVGNLKEFMLEKFNAEQQHFRTVDEKFHGVETQFIERDVRVKESATATATAVAAALQAAKEAVGEQNKSFTLSIDKSEKATGEQINQQRVLFETTTKGLNDKISDLQERLARIDALGLGRREAVGDSRANAGELRGYLASGIAFVLFLVALVDFATRLAGK